MAAYIVNALGVLPRTAPISSAKVCPHQSHPETHPICFIYGVHAYFLRLNMQ